MVGVEAESQEPSAQNGAVRLKQAGTGQVEPQDAPAGIQCEITHGGKIVELAEGLGQRLAPIVRRLQLGLLRLQLDLVHLQLMQQAPGIGFGSDPAAARGVRPVAAP